MIVEGTHGLEQPSWAQLDIQMGFFIYNDYKPYVRWSWVESPFEYLFDRPYFAL